MDHLRLSKALTTAGATITSDDAQHAWTARKGDRALHWYTQEGFPNKERKAAVCLHRKSPHTDIMTDCFCDSFFDTIKSAVHELG